MLLFLCQEKFCQGNFLEGRIDPFFYKVIQEVYPDQKDPLSTGDRTFWNNLLGLFPPASGFYRLRYNPGRQPILELRALLAATASSNHSDGHDVWGGSGDCQLERLLQGYRSGPWRSLHALFPL